MKHLTSTFLLVFIASMLFAQSPWTKEKGAGFAQLAVNAIPTYSEFFKDQNLTRVSSREYAEFGAQLYGEYGIINGTSIVGSIPLKYLTAGDQIDSIVLTQDGNMFAPGNLKLAVKQRIYNDGIAVAGQLGIEVPLGKSDISTGLRTSFECWTFTPMLSVGGGFGKGYAYGYGGVGLRTNDYSHTFNGGLEAGYKVLKPLWTMLFLDINRSFSNGDRAESFAILDSGFYVNDQEWISLGIKFLFEINDKMGLTASSTLSAFAAHQVPQSPSVALGFYTQWTGKKDVVPVTE